MVAWRLKNAGETVYHVFGGSYHLRLKVIIPMNVLWVKWGQGAICVHSEYFLRLAKEVGP